MIGGAIGDALGYPIEFKRGISEKDCVRVEIDHVPHNEMGGDMMFEETVKFRGAPMDDFEQQIKNIDETFKPDDITLSKEISCVWETSN